MAKLTNAIAITRPSDLGIGITKVNPRLLSAKALKLNRYIIYIAKVNARACK